MPPPLSPLAPPPPNSTAPGPFAYLTPRPPAWDILHAGSGNIGATNVGRVLGRRFGLLVFALDFAKGAVPTLLCLRWFGVTAGVIAGLAAFLGHLFPVYLRFRGGKGVATGAGVVAVLVPLPSLAALLAWAVVFAAGRYVSLASLAAAALLCAWRLALTPAPWAPPERVVTGFSLAVTALVFVRHHGNIRRLLRGTENRAPETPAMLLFGKTLHVLALGLWFGTVVFFSLAGVLLQRAFEEVSTLPRGERPVWFPLPDAFDRELPGAALPSPLRKEQGSQAFGAAVGPLFPWLFGIQGICGVVALATAVPWSYRPGGAVHRLRAGVLLLALLGVGA